MDEKIESERLKIGRENERRRVWTEKRVKEKREEKEDRRRENNREEETADRKLLDANRVDRTLK